VVATQTNMIKQQTPDLVDNDVIKQKQGAAQRETQIRLDCDGIRMKCFSHSNPWPPDEFPEQEQNQTKHKGITESTTISEKHHN